MFLNKGVKAPLYLLHDHMSKSDIVGLGQWFGQVLDDLTCLHLLSLHPGRWPPNSGILAGSLGSNSQNESGFLPLDCFRRVNMYPKKHMRFWRRFGAALGVLLRLLLLPEVVCARIVGF